MKICYDYEIFSKQKFSSVASRYYYNLIKNLNYNSNLELKVFANIYLNEKIYDLPSNVIIGKKLNKRIPFTGRALEILNSLICNYQILNFKPEIVHKTYYSNNVIKKKNKIVLTVFDLWHEKNSNYKYHPKKNAINIADHIICPSEKTKKDLIDIYKLDKNKKISVTYFGIEKFKNFQIANDPIFFEKPYILYVGERSRYKNFKNFIYAYSRSEKLKKNFNILCFGGELFSEDEKIFFKENKILNLVFRLTKNDDRTLYSAYKNARCFVFPSSHEGLGLPPLEAMSLKCPVITSNHEAILEGVGDAAITFDPHEWEDIKNKIEDTIFSEESINKLILKGYERSKKFTWEKCTKETYNIYLNLR